MKHEERKEGKAGVSQFLVPVRPLCCCLLFATRVDEHGAEWASSLWLRTKAVRHFQAVLIIIFFFKKRICFGHLVLQHSVGFSFSTTLWEHFLDKNWFIVNFPSEFPKTNNLLRILCKNNSPQSMSWLNSCLLKDLDMNKWKKCLVKIYFSHLLRNIIRNCLKLYCIITYWHEN